MSKIIPFSFLFLLTMSLAWAEDSTSITEKQISEITQTLKNVLEENHKLADRNEQINNQVKDLQNQLQDLQKKSSGNSEDIEVIKKEQSQLSQDNKRLKGIIEDFKNQLDDVLTQSQPKAPAPAQDYSEMKVSEKVDLIAEKSSELNSDTADVYYQLAEEAFAAGEYQKAIDAYQKCLALNPDGRFIAQINRQIAAAQRMLGR